MPNIAAAAQRGGWVEVESSAGDRYYYFYLATLYYTVLSYDGANFQFIVRNDELMNLRLFDDFQIHFMVKVEKGSAEF